MNETSDELIAIVNGNPSVPLDVLIKQVQTALSPMQYIVSDTLALAINNVYIENYASNFSSKNLEPIFLPQKVKIHLGGTIKVQVTMKYKMPDSATSEGSPCLQIYVNGILAKKIRAYETSYTAASVEVPVNAGDIITFAVYSGITKLVGGGVWYCNTTYLQANSLKIYAEVKDLRGTGQIEVSDQ